MNRKSRKSVLSIEVLAVPLLLSHKKHTHITHIQQPPMAII